MLVRAYVRMWLSDTDLTSSKHTCVCVRIKMRIDTTHYGSIRYDRGIDERTSSTHCSNIHSLDPTKKKNFPHSTIGVNLKRSPSQQYYLCSQQVNPHLNLLILLYWTGDRVPTSSRLVYLKKLRPRSTCWYYLYSHACSHKLYTIATYPITTTSSGLYFPSICHSFVDANYYLLG